MQLEHYIQHQQQHQFYLPKQLSEEEVKAVVAEIIKETGATTIKDMGKVMGAASAKLAGQTDNKTLSGIVKAMLG